MDLKDSIGIILRYLVLIFLGSFNLYILYFIFTPLTVFPVYFVLNGLYGANLVSYSLTNPSGLIFLKGFYASIIPACVAGAAYYFLLILNLTTPMSHKKRFLSLAFLLVGFLVLNIIRIIVFASIISDDFQYFDEAHSLTWYVGSTLLVVVLWFVNVNIFKIREIPVFTDLNKIYGEIVNKK